MPDDSPPWEIVTRSGRPPLVFLHGLGLNRTYFRPLAGRLGREGIGSVAIDLPGHGRARGVVASSYADVAAHVLRILDGLGIRDFVPFGHSYGGMVALALQRAHPERIRASILVATSVETTLKTVRPSFVLLGLPFCRLLNFLVWWRDADGNPEVDFSTEPIVRSDLRCLLATSLATSRTGLAQASAVMGRESLRDGSPRVVSPVLFMEPTRDQIFSRRGFDDLAREIPGVRRLRLDGTHHVARNWDAVGDAVLRFLEDLP